MGEDAPLQVGKHQRQADGEGNAGHRCAEGNKPQAKQFHGISEDGVQLVVVLPVKVVRDGPANEGGHRHVHPDHLAHSQLLVTHKLERHVDKTKQKIRDGVRVITASY